MGARSARGIAGAAAIALAGVLGPLASVHPSCAALRPRCGGSLERGFIGAIHTLDPLLARGRAERDAALQVHAGLYRIGADGEPERDLVEHAEMSADGLSVRLLLRQASFHDGRRVTAEDARVSLSRYLAGTGAGGLFNVPGGDNAIVSVLGERELRLRVEAVPALWMWLLADPRAAVMPGDSVVTANATVTARGTGAGLIGAGPFRVLRLAPDGRILTLGPWLDHPRGRPYFDEVVYRAQSDESALLFAHRREKADVIDIGGPEAEAATVVARGHALVALRIDTRRAPMDHEAVRESVIAALRIDALVDVVMAGRAERASGLLRLRTGNQPPRAYPVSAGSPLKQGSRPLVLRFDDEFLRPVAERIRVDLHATGIETVLGTRDWDLALVLLPGGDGQPELELADMAHAAGKDLDEALRLAASGDPRTPRIADRLAAERLLLADGSLVPLFRHGYSLLARPEVRDIAVGPGGLAVLESAWRWPRATTP